MTLRSAGLGAMAAVLTAISVGVASGVPQSGGLGRPNILLIVADDVGAEASAIYPRLAGSGSQVPTPNIARLAAAGLVFDNVWASPMCSPTRATMLTGLYGHHTGVTNVGLTLPTSTTSIFEFMAARSPALYGMAVFGKWHLGGVAGSPTGVNHVRQTGVPVFKGTLGAQIPDFFNWTAVDGEGRTTAMTTYSTTAITDFAIEFITNHRATRPNDPWFIDVSYNAAHMPFQAPPPHLHNVDIGGVPPGTVANSRAIYQAMIQAMDTEIGRLLKVVDLGNTLVIYVGDNGTPAVVKDPTAGVRGSKQSVFEGGVKVPLVIAGAGVTRRNQREAAVVVSTDLFDTIAETAGIAGNDIDRQTNDSFSLHPLFSAVTGKSGRTFGFTELCNGTAMRRYAIRDTRYKLLSDNGVWALHDLEADPREASNLFDDAKLRAVQSALMAQITALKANAPFGCFER